MRLTSSLQRQDPRMRHPIQRAAAAVACLAAAVPPVPAPPGPTKVMVIVEENRTYGQVITHPDAPYLTRLARAYGSATHMVANYPVGCPSLAAYILMTSGGTADICDDRGPRHHPIGGPNIFAQLDA